MKDKAITISRVQFLTAIHKHFLITVLLASALNAKAIVPDGIGELDSAYRTTSKSNQIKKLLFYPIINIKDKAEMTSVNALLEKHNLGGVIMNSGQHENVKKWIKEFKSKRKEVPLFVLGVDDLLEFPLSGFPKFPNKFQMEIISNFELIESLGKVFGDLARGSGFDILMLDPSKYDSTLLFNAPDKQWIKYYLKGIQNSEISLILGQQKPLSSASHRFKHTDSISKLGFSGISLSKLSTVILPLNKKNRMALKFNGITFDYAKDIGEKNQLFENGSDVLILPNKIKESLNIIEHLTNDLKIGKRKVKQKFKRYFNLQNRVKNIKRDSYEMEKLIFQLSNILQKLLTESVVCLKNKNDILPFKNLDVSHFVSLAGGSEGDQIFRDYLDKYTKVAHYDFEYVLENQKKALSTLSHFDRVIVNLNESVISQKQILEFLRILKGKTKVIVVYQGNKSALDLITEFNALIWVPQILKTYASIIPQILFGALNATGQFPFNTSLKLQPIKLKETNRLSFAFSESVGVNSQILNKIDRLVSDAINTYTMPGCQVLMIKDGTVVYDKNFGYSTYDSLLKIDNFSVYDIASITKVTATLPALMFLDQENKIHIDDKLDEHLGIYQDTDKSNITIKNLLRHQSGLRSYIPFWRKADVDRGQDFKYKISNNRKKKKEANYLNINWNDSIQYWIKKSSFNSLLKSDNTYGYLYSDLGFMVLQNLAEIKLNQPMADFLAQNIYAPLGMNSTSFEPLCYFPLNDIVPTEQDTYFRNELVWGNVHDRNAALTDGKSGHAGLFSNANDLSKYLQMHLQKGNYGGRRFFLPKVIEEFTAKTSDSRRRALGWDKPNRKVGNSSKYASEASYGHTGFTGTMVWVDPKYDLIYIFLSNRVYPDSKNNKLSQNNIRTKIQDIMYESFLRSNFE